MALLIYLQAYVRSFCAREMVPHCPMPCAFSSVPAVRLKLMAPRYARRRFCFCFRDGMQDSAQGLYAVEQEKQFLVFPVSFLLYVLHI